MLKRFTIMLTMAFAIGLTHIYAQASEQSDCYINQCQFRTQTMGGWGAVPHGNNPGTYLHANFAGAFPNDLVIGCNNRTITLTSAWAVTNFLPASGNPKPLPNGNIVDPVNYKNTFAGQVTALALSLGFDQYDPGFGTATALLKDQLIASGPYAGWTIQQVFDEANAALGGCIPANTISQLNAAVSSINENYVDGFITGNFIQCNPVFPAVTINGVNIDCYGLVNGSACAIPSGGTPGYTYLWSNGATTACISNLTIGTYTVIVTDTNSCRATASVTITQPAVIVSNISSVGACVGSSNGSACVAPSGGVSSYQYSWSNGATTACINNISTGWYFVTITDNNNCIINDSVFVNVYDPPVCNISGSTTICPGTTFTYSAPAGMSGYLWTISGNGAISGSNNQSTVTVNAGLLCGQSFTLTLSIDSASCFVSCNLTVNVNDTSAPIISGVGANQTIVCTGTPVFSQPTASDNCDPNPALTFNDLTTPGSCPQEYTIIRTWTATDACGNISTASQSVNLIDTVAPLLSCPTSFTIFSCEDSITWSLPIVSDNCDPNPVITFTDLLVPGNCPHNFVIIRTWTATDACGNSATIVHTAVVSDNTAPVISGVGANQTINCPSTPVFSQPTATDNCAIPTLTFNDVTTAGNCPQNYIVTRTWTATDACGNSSTASQSITVIDNIAPIIVGCISDTTICFGEPLTINLPIATDNCAGLNLTVTYVRSDGLTLTDPFSVGTTTIVFTADDGCNVATCTTTVTVLPAPDSPQLLPFNAQLDCINPTTTLCISSPDPDYIYVWLQGSTVIDTANCITVSEAGNYFVFAINTISNCVGLQIGVPATVTMILDTIPPVISGVGPDATIICGPAVFSTPTVTDNFDPLPTLTFVTDTLINNGPYCYVVQRTWTAVDTCGNVATAQQTITVQDTIAPVISGVGANATIACPATPVFSQPTATDNCGTAVIAFNDVTTPGNCPQEYSITRTWTAVDQCGNVSTASQTINVVDDVAPVLLCPTNFSFFTCEDSITWGLPIVTDNCDPNPVLTFSDQIIPGNCPFNYVIIRLWTATDACGNAGTIVHTAVVSDSLAPVISGVGADATINCGPAVFSSPSAVDNCDPNPSFTFITDTLSNNGPYCYVVRRTWTATDACGNTSTEQQTITVNDNVAPVIAGVAPISVAQCPITPVWSQPTVSDNCDPNPTFTFVDNTIPGNCPQNYTLTRTWTATDACGNVSTAMQSIIVIDTIAPVISGVGANATIACPATPVFSQPTAADNCGTTVIAFNDVTTPGNCPQEYSITRTWTAVDQCGNASTASQTINVVDDVAPVLTVGLDATINCGPAVFTLISVTDACDVSPTVAFTTDTLSNNGPYCYVVRRTWTATDACGNTSTAQQIITVNDNVAPVIAGVAPTTVILCTASPVWSQPTVTDNCDPNPTITFVDNTVPGNCPQNYTLTRTWTATDACGNVSTAMQSIIVIDTIAPVISGVGANATIACPATPVFSQPTATDNCGTAVIAFNDVTTPGNCPQEYSITRTWTAVDQCGNASTASQTINVVDDIAPILSCPTNFSFFSCEDSITWGLPIVTDNCDPNPVITFSDLVILGNCPNNYVIIRLWTATDACGNSGTIVHTAIVSDSIAPVISGVGANQTINCPATPVFSQPTATDDCSTPTLTFVDVTIQGNCPLSYSITRTWTASDACGNSSTAQQTITVEDVTAPVIAGVAPTTVILCTVTPVWSQASVSDNCDPNPTLTFVDNTIPGNCPQNYTLTRTWTATDACGNVSTAIQSIIVIDTIAPVISGVGANATIACPATPVFSQPTAADNCGTTVIAFNDVTTPGNCPQEYTITRTWTAVDQCGNSSTASQSITVIDDVAPVIIAGANTTITCGPAVFILISVIDACDLNPTVSFTTDTLSNNGPHCYVVQRTWTVIDACGNSSTSQQTITVEDLTAPVIAGVAPTTVILCTASPVWSQASVSDNCDPNPTLTFVDNTIPGNCPQNYTLTRTWTATDACGNVSTAIQSIIVIDTIAPVISGVGANQTINCPATPVFSTPTATDDCGTAVIAHNDVTIPGNCLQEYTITRTWTAVDQCGNSLTASQTINVVDTIAPVLTCPTNFSFFTCEDSITWGLPIVTDNCDPNPVLTFSDQVIPGNCPNNYVIIRLWTATDACGNAGTIVHTAVVSDSIAPVISGVGANQTINCPSTPVFSSPTATDNCSTPTLTFADVTLAGNCPQEYTIVRTWTATDACGNTSTASVSINVTDNVAPVISGVGSNATINCPATPVFATATATDNCDPNPTLTFADVTLAGNCPQEYTIVRTWTATDACGNTSTASVSINVTDNVAPVISGVGSNATINCPAIPVFLAASVSDNCDPNPTLTFVDVTTPGNCPQEYTITRTWTASDACGNTSTASQTINVDDDVAPVLTCPTNFSFFTCEDSITWGLPIVTDNCDPNPVLTFSDQIIPGNCPNNYVIIRLWTATDACGNAGTIVHTAVITDSIAPVINGVGVNAIINCPATPVFSSPTAIDNCSTPTLTFVDVTLPGNCPQEYTMTRTWTAIDACGNTSTASQAVSVIDNITPILIGCLTDTIICQGEPLVINLPTATDNCVQGNITVTYTRSDGLLLNDPFIVGTTTIIFTAGDGCNIATCTTTVTVLPTPVSPQLLIPSAQLDCINPTAQLCVLNPDPSYVYVWYNGLIFVDSAACITVSSPGSYFVFAVNVVTGCASQVVGSNNNVTLVLDTIPPVITVGPDATINCGPAVFSQATVTDNIDPNPSLTFITDTLSANGPYCYVVQRIWTATDTCGNTSTAQQTITVQDLVAPIIAGVGSSTTISCPATPVFSIATVSDNCDPNPSLTFVDVTTPGSCPQEYTITRTWSAIDACGNVSSALQSINVVDTLAPVLHCPVSFSTFSCEDSITWGLPIVTDNCDPNPVLTFSDVIVPGNCPSNYVIIRLWTATDACGNAGTITHSAVISDNEAPVISGVGANQIINCPATPIFSSPTATDNCSTPTLTFDDATVAGNCPQEYTIIRTWTATDACGNTSTAQQTITVNDNVEPVIAGVGVNQAIQCTATPIFSVATVSDNCDPNPTLTFVDVTTQGACPQEYSITRTWTAIDQCGNTSTASQIINVVDDIAPVLTCPTNFSFFTCEDSITWGLPIVADNCDPNPVLTYSDQIVLGNCPFNYVVIRLWTATDACGNAGTIVHTAVISDSLAPVISGVGADATINCGPAVFSAPTAADNCDPNPSLTSVTDTLSNNGPYCYVVRRTWTATDACGNTSTAQQTITVQDNVAPVIAGVGVNQTIQCTATPVFSVATASDNCDPNPTLTFADVTTPGNCPQEYTITRTWTASDACGNISTALQTINVIDNVAPVLSCPTNFSFFSCEDSITWGLPIVTDNCDPNPVLTFSDQIIPGNCPNNYVIIRLWTATDACGNAGTIVHTAVVSDSIAPVISGVGTNQSFQCAGTPVFSQPVATDNCGTASLTFTDVTTQGNCPQSYSITRTWTATDVCGNSSTASQTISVDDNTAPIISGVGANLTLACGPVVFSSPTVADNCDPNPSLTFVTDTLSNNGMNCYSVQRIWTATDACGNVTTAQQTITIQDNVAPVISGVGQNQTIACPAQPVFSQPTATDNCATPVLTFSDVTFAGNCPQSYSITRTWTATDACGNTSTASQTISLDDNIAPILVGCLGDTTICQGAPLVITVPTATDNCVGNVTVTTVRSDGLTLTDPFPLGNTTVTFTATDGCNTSVCSLIVIVLPTPDAPQILIPTAQLDCVNPTAQLCVVNPDPAYQYVWTNGGVNISTSPCITVSEAGSYFVFAVNAATGCASQVIGSNNNVTLDTTTVTASCNTISNVTVNGGNDGSLQICVSSGTAPFTISLAGQNIVLNSVGCHTFSNLTAGIYTATITGANGCFATTTCEITQPNCEGFRTQTQGGWGQCHQNGNNPGTYLANNFAAAFPSGLSVGCNNTLLLTSASAVCNFLPSGSTPSALPTGNLVNPGNSYNNVLAGQVVALTLNVGFDYYDANFAPSNTNLGDLIINSGTFAGWTVNQLLAEANNVLGGCPSAYAPSQINAAVSAINENYVDGNVTGNFLDCPPPAPQAPAVSEIVFNNYPNPFSKSATIEFKVPETEVVVVDVYNYAGAFVARVFNATAQKNVLNKVEFEGKDLSNGIYIFRISTPTQTTHGKMILVR